MSRSERLLAWLEAGSDWLSPILVKEVRQMTRGREFASSFGATLIGGMGVAFLGAADALTGSGTAGRWTFASLMSCLGILGFGIVPISAFTSLRNERVEQTLDLITLTALSPLRVIVGKLVAQAVKLTALFAGMAPFIAMSFLLGGIDFVTLLVSLLVLFLWSTWACAVCLFLSTLMRSRAMYGLVIIGIALVLFLVLGLGRGLFFSATSFRVSVTSGSPSWLPLAMSISFCLVTLMNLVLLAENRLSLATETNVTRLRIGFLIQFLLIVGWMLVFVSYPPTVKANAIEALALFGGMHLAAVAMFAVTDDLVVHPRVPRRINRPSQWQWLLAPFRAGAGTGAVYVLAHTVVLLYAVWMLGGTKSEARWLLAICGYIWCFTGVPTLAFRLRWPERAASLHLRVAILVLLLLSVVLPDVVHYLVWQPEVLSLKFSARHLLNPLRTAANWRIVEAEARFGIPFVIGITGLISYVVLIQMAARKWVQQTPVRLPGPTATAREADSADVLY